MKAGTDYIGVGVGAVIFNKEGRVFLALRSKGAQNERGKWECPGGAMKFSESFERALKREIKEEFGVEIKILDELFPFNNVLKEEGQHWIGLCFICKITKGKPKILEPEKCNSTGWFTLSQMKKMPLTRFTKFRLQQILEKYPREIKHIK